MVDAAFLLPGLGMSPDTHYLVGSAGSCCNGINSTYHLVVARSESLFGPYVNKVGERALDNGFSNLLCRSEDVVGPGHCSEFIQDDSGQYWVLYHGYSVADVDGGRRVFLDKVDWDEDGWPVIKDMKPSRTECCPELRPADNSSVPPNNPAL